MKSRLLIILLTISITIPVSSFVDQPAHAKETFQTGMIQWDSRCYSTHDVATVTVIDRDMNLDSTVPEQFQIDVWSDWLEDNGESRILPVTVIETGNSTGIFEGLVFLGSAYDESTGHRVPVGIENMISAKYVDSVAFDSNELEIIETTSAIILSIGEPWERWEELSSLYDISLVYDPCLKKQMDAVGTGDDFTKLDIFYPVPLKQIKSGLHVDEIQCKKNLVLVQKHDGSPACVKEQSIPRLMERNWIKDDTKQQCETFSGIWNKDFATCFDFSDEYDCKDMGGKLVSRSYTGEQPDYSKKSDSFVCEFRK